jgi:hypothetical protein
MFYFLIVGSTLHEGVHVRPFEAAQTRLQAIVTPYLQSFALREPRSHFAINGHHQYSTGSEAQN